MHRRGCDRGTASRTVKTVGSLLLGFLVAACGGTPQTSGPPEPTSPSASVASSAPPAGSAAPPSATPAATAQPSVSASGGPLTELAALLPAEVNGVALERSGYDFAALPPFVPLDLEDDEFDRFLKANGKSMRDVGVALAFPAGSSSGMPQVLAMAFQIKGIDSKALETWVTGEVIDTTKRTSVGGKQVYGEKIPGLAAWVYVKGDTFFYVFGTDDRLAEGLVAALP